MNEFDPGDYDLISIVGPTASGKSALALAFAEKFRGEIISADSVQVYRHFDIGSGKPSADELKRVPHHMIDVIDPLDDMDAALFAGAADRHIKEVQRRGRVPIICGGTFLWTRALLFGLAPAPPGSEALRRQHQGIASAEGRAALHAKLQQVDRISAEKLSPNDFVRVSRALEVFELTGKPLSEYQAEHGFRTPRYKTKLFGIRFDAEALSERILRRAQDMFARGWLDEVRALRGAGYGNARAMRAVGYREVFEALEAANQVNPQPLNEALLLEAVVRATRIFARRQRTWLRDADVEWLTGDEAVRFGA